jgi:citrate synthase
MNASTFATMVVASTLSDIYLSVGAGIAALHGPLHGGANEEVIRTLMRIGEVKRVRPCLEEVLSRKGRIPGFGHRVYKAYDPRARILGPLAQFLVEHKRRDKKPLFDIAQELEKEMSARIGAEKKIFPNVDFFSGIVYSCLDVAPDMFTTLFAVSRTAGWTARVMEYLQHNRIFRPRAMYIGEFNNKYVPLANRAG